MSSSLFRAPGEEFLRHSGASAPGDSLFVRRGSGGAARPRPRPKPEPEEAAPAAEPAEEEIAKPRAKVTLSDPALQSEGPASFHDKVKATARAEFGDEAANRQITLELWAVSPDGERQRIQSQGCAVPKDGVAKADLALLPPNFKDEAGTPLRECEYLLIATHPDAKPVESPPLKAQENPNRPFEGVVFYSPVREEYLIFETEEELKPLLEDIRQVGSLRDRMQQAWTVPDSAKRMEAQEKLAEEAEKLFGGKTSGNAKQGMEELILVADHQKKGTFKGWEFVPDKKGNYQRNRFKKSEAAEAYAKLMKHGSHRKPKSALDGKFKANLCKTEPKSGQLWAPEWANQKGSNAAEYFTWSSEAALCRYMAGWDGGEITFDPKKKTLKVGASGQVSGSLFEGSLSGTLHIPDAQGVNILRLLQGVKFLDTYQADRTRVCLMKVCVEGTMTAFAGASLSGAVTFPSLCFDKQSEGKQKAEASASASAFVGIRGTAGVKGSVQWASQPGAFKALGAIGYELGASAGAGAEATVKIDYQDGRFTFQFSAAAAYGFGVKGGFSYEVSAREGWDMLGHLLDCVDFHKVKEIAKDAYEAYMAASTQMIVAEQQHAQFQAQLVRAVAGKVAETLRNWILNQEGEFVLSKLHLKKDLAGKRSTLAKMSPESLGLALAVLMKTREESDFDTIMLILGSTTWRNDGTGAKLSPDHKLKWVLRYITGSPNFDGPDKEQKKAESMKAGIKKLREFGRGTGYPGARSNEAFLEKLNIFLKEFAL